MTLDAILPGPAALGLFGLHLAAGLALGVVHFGGLWWTVRRIAGGSGARAAVATIARFALLVGALVLAARQGAGPLLGVALGVLAVRPLAVRRVREAAP